MARTHLSIPDKIIFSCVIPVRITDINYGNHVGNDSFVAIIHEARMKWLSGAGYTELNIGGPGLIMSELNIEFKKEANYGDEIVVELAVGDLSKQWFEIFYRLTPSNEPEQVLAHAKTVMVCYDYALAKPASLPESFTLLNSKAS